MKPVSRKEKRRRFLLTAAFISVPTLLFFLHLGHLAVTNGLSGQLLMDALDHMTSHPLSFLPTSGRYVGYGLLVCALIVLLLFDREQRSRRLRREEENGSAKWNEDRTVFEKAYTAMPRLGTGSPNMIMTRDILLNMDTRKTHRNNNLTVIGSAGTMKSRSVVLPNLLQANASFVVTDPSGELLEATGTFLKENGYEIRALNLSDMNYSNRYNPFCYIRNQEGVLRMITSLIQNTSPSDAKKGDPFWEKAETALLEAVCFYLIEKFDPPERNFSMVMELLRLAEAPEGQASRLDLLFADLAKEKPRHIAVKSYAVYKSAGDGRAAQSIRVSCQVRLHTFNLDSVQKLTCSDNMDLRGIGDKKVALFCITPAADTTFNFLAALIYTQIFDELYNHAETECPGRRLPVPVRFLLDEFANIGTIPQFPERLSTMRKYDISCTIILQALGQLKAMYRDKWEVILSNCDSILYLGSSDKESREYISALLGKETIYAVNSSATKGRQASTTVSYNTAGRELMTAAELRTMDNQDCIYVLRGLDPFYERKFDLLKHPNYPKTGAADQAQCYDVTAYHKTKE